MARASLMWLSMGMFCVSLACRSSGKQDEQAVLSDFALQEALVAEVLVRSKNESSLARAGDSPAGSGRWGLSVLGSKLSLDTARAIVEARHIVYIDMVEPSPRDAQEVLSRAFYPREVQREVNHPSASTAPRYEYATYLWRRGEPEAEPFVPRFPVGDVP